VRLDPTAVSLPVASIIPNPNQPRKQFDQDQIAELAASIIENGLMQPITVQFIAPQGEARYMIVAGERRWRAHRIGGLTHVLALVVEVNEARRDLLAIIENLHRSDITPLEEARAFQRMLDGGMSVHELTQRLGFKRPLRITERIALLRLRPEYLRLLEQGHLTPSQATELARLSQTSQPSLFTMIREGRCDTYPKLRAAADGILAAESQSALFANLPQPTAAEAAALTAFERKLSQIVQLIGSGFKDNEIVVLKKIKPTRAATIVVELGIIRKHLAMLEREVQMVAAQGEFAVAHFE